MIEKPAIIITSGGRTGTMFFADFFKKVLDRAACFHEPENLDYFNLKQYWFVFKHFGIINPIINKLTGKWGITSLSNRRINNELNGDEVAKRLEQERKKLIESLEEDVYVEASYHYYGLIDIIPKVFSNCRIVYIARDGRDWIRSHMNKREFYTKKSLHTIFKTRLSPAQNDSYYSKWKKMDRFTRLCWAWSTINNYALKTLNDNKQARLFYFEDIFLSEDKYENLKKLVDFATTFNNIKLQPKPFKSLLDEKINIPKDYNFPKWENWTSGQKEIFKSVCGKTMKKLNYNYL